jgi:hypothetical protein
MRNGFSDNLVMIVDQDRGNGTSFPIVEITTFKMETVEFVIIKY